MIRDLTFAALQDGVAVFADYSDDDVFELEMPIDEFAALGGPMRIKRELA